MSFVHGQRHVRELHLRRPAIAMRYAISGARVAPSTGEAGWSHPLPSIRNGEDTRNKKG
jgi:hypothetical protein